MCRQDAESPQPENAFADGVGFGVIGGGESDDGPGGLRGSAGSGLELKRLVTFAAFTPAAVGVLHGGKPESGARDGL